MTGANRNGVSNVQTSGDAGEKACIVVFDSERRHVITQSSVIEGRREMDVRFPCLKGEVYYFLCEGLDRDKEVDWNVDEKNIPGISHMNPVSIREGVHQASHHTGNDVWYEFIPDQEGVYKISSVGYTDENTCLFVYGENPELSIASSNDLDKVMQSQVHLECKAGQRILIKWTNAFTQSAYKWELKLVE